MDNNQLEILSREELYSVIARGIIDTNEAQKQCQAAKQEVVKLRAQVERMAKDVETAKGLLEQQTKNTLDALKERDEARVEANERLSDQLDQINEIEKLEYQLEQVQGKLAEVEQEREKYRYSARQFCGRHVGQYFKNCPACSIEEISE